MEFERKYGVASTLYSIPLIIFGGTKFAATTDWTPAAGDVKVRKDGGAWANIATLPTASEQSWDFALSAAELTAAVVQLKVVDAAGDEVEDQDILIATYGNASAQYLLDRSEAQRGTDIAMLAANGALDLTVAKEATKFNPSADTVANVTLVATATTVTDGAKAATALTGQQVIRAAAGNVGDFAPSSDYYVEFTTHHPLSGLNLAADATPVVTVTLNGSADVLFTLAVAPLAATGHYSASGVVPSSYLSGARVSLLGSALVSGVAGAAVIGGFTVRNSNVDDVLSAVNAIDALSKIPLAVASVVVTQGTPGGVVSNMDFHDGVLYTLTDTGGGILAEIKWTLPDFTSLREFEFWGNIDKGTANDPGLYELWSPNLAVPAWVPAGQLAPSVGEVQLTGELSNVYVDSVTNEFKVRITRVADLGAVVNFDQLITRYSEASTDRVAFNGKITAAGLNWADLDPAVASSLAGSYDPAEAYFPRTHQTFEVMEYDNGLFRIYFDANVKSALAVDDQCIITPKTHGSHVNEGLITGAYQDGDGIHSWIVLNAASEPGVDNYEDQTFQERSGLLVADRSRHVITSQPNATSGFAEVKVEKMDPLPFVAATPDEPNVYAMLPVGVHNEGMRVGITALASKDATAPGYIGGTFNPVVDSQEAIRAAVDNLTPGGGTVNPLLLTLEDQDTAPLVSAQVQVTDVATGTVFFKSGVTDASGQFTASGLTAGDYLLVGFLAGYNVPDTVITVIGGGGSQTVACTRLTVNPPVNPELSTLYGYLHDISAVDREGVEITVTAASGCYCPVFVDDTGVTRGIVSVLTNAAGYFEVPVLKNTPVLIAVEDLQYNKTATLTEDITNIADL